MGASPKWAPCVRRAGARAIELRPCSLASCDAGCRGRNRRRRRKCRASLSGNATVECPLRQPLRLRHVVRPVISHWGRGHDELLQSWGERTQHCGCRRVGVAGVGIWSRGMCLANADAVAVRVGVRSRSRVFRDVEGAAIADRLPRLRPEGARVFAAGCQRRRLPPHVPRPRVVHSHAIATHLLQKPIELPAGKRPEPRAASNVVNAASDRPSCALEGHDHLRTRSTRCRRAFP